LTCIVALRHQDAVYIGGDAAAVTSPEIGSKAWSIEKQAKIRDHFVKHGMTPPTNIHTCGN
jgi:hypothetical protein